MHVLDSFLIRDVAGECIAVPTGAVAAKFSGIISLNDTAAFLLRLLHTEQSEDSLLKAMLAEFDVDEDTARKDITELLNTFSALGLLINNKT